MTVVAGSNSPAGGQRAALRPALGHRTPWMSALPPACPPPCPFLAEQRLFQTPHLSQSVTPCVSFPCLSLSVYSRNSFSMSATFHSTLLRSPSLLVPHACAPPPPACSRPLVLWWLLRQPEVSSRAPVPV